MKKAIALILILSTLVCLSACGGSETANTEPVDLNALYETYTSSLPEMFVMDADTMLNYLGIQAENCVQVITAVSNDGLRADEVWLIEAKDSASLEQLKELANNRIQAKADETVTYSPDQYKIVEKAVVITEGNYLAMLVSPEVDSMKTAFEEAVK